MQHQLHKSYRGSVTMEKDKIMKGLTEYIFDLFEEKREGLCLSLKGMGMLKI